MNKGPNQPQSPGANHRRRRRRRGASAKKPNAGQPNQQQPSNGSTSSSGQNQGGRRNNRNRRGGGPAFVGPMDHSYRNGQGQNGNTVDGGNRGGAGFHAARFPQPDMTPVITRTDAPARIFCFVDDLFFLAKIQETARKINVKVEFVKAIEPILDRAQDEVPESERPTLVVFDLNNLGIKPLSMIPKLRAKLKKSASIIGFVSHLQGDLKMKAQEAGCDMVMPRSAFSQNLAQLLRRHGAPEDLHEVVE